MNAPVNDVVIGSISNLPEFINKNPAVKTRIGKSDTSIKRYLKKLQDQNLIE